MPTVKLGECAFERLGVMIDCSRNSVMTVAALKRLISLLSKAGYNTVQLYTEDTFEVNNEPYFGYLRGRYSKAELKELDAFAQSCGVELIPCVQTLAHLNAIFRWPAYRAINDCNDILLADEERTYSLLENIFDTLAECFTSRNVNIGMDEAHTLGLGKYLDKHGYQNRADIMLKHLTRVNKIANAHGFTCSMWSDMFFRLAFGGYYVSGETKLPDEAREKAPENIKLIYWDYYSLDRNRYDGMLKQHKQFGNDIVFAGGAWTWIGLAPANEYSIKATEAAFGACIDNGVKEVFLTMWGDNGGSCSPFSVLPALITAAEYAHGNHDQNKIEARFKELVGCDYAQFAAVDLPNKLTLDQEVGTCNPSKYLLYNDCLLGAWDSAVTKGDGEIYKSHAARLKTAESNAEWSFLFKPLRLLCEALYYKADLGVCTRELYKAGDKAGLNKLIEERYEPLVKKLGEFYEAFAGYWDTLFKPHGFDVMDVRLGGLSQRLKHVIQKLKSYTVGQTDAIPELDDEILDKFGGGKTYEKKPASDNTWTGIVSVNIV